MVTLQIKNVKSSLSQELSTLKSGGDLEWEHLTYKVRRHINYVVTWQIKNFTPLLSQGLWIQNLAKWWLRMRGPHPQSHMTLQYSDHVTKKKRFFSTFTTPMDPKFSGNLGWGDLIYIVTWHIDHVVLWQIINVVSPLSQGLWTPNLAGWYLRMRGPHPQCHVTLQHCGHLTNKKR